MNVELLKDAYQILAGIPAERFVRNLRMLVTENSCNTLACGIGWLALYPYAPFERITLTPNQFTMLDGNIMDYDVIASKVFDLPLGKAFSLFVPRREVGFDGELLHNGLHLSDKALLLYRIRRILGQSEAVAYQHAKQDGK